MTELIIDLFEIIKIQQDERVIPLRFQFFKAAVQRDPAADSGQSVMTDFPL